MTIILMSGGKKVLHKIYPKRVFRCEVWEGTEFEGAVRSNDQFFHVKPSNIPPQIQLLAQGHLKIRGTI